MSEVSLRVANFVKLFSMFLAILSLIYLYAYATDKLSSIYTRDLWIYSLKNTHIFYTGLGAFAIFNLLISAGIGLYRSARGVDASSIFFRSEIQKHKMLIWLTYLQAGTNYVISSMVFYLALVKINEADDAASYLYFPISGLVALSILFVSLILLLKRKA